MALEELIVVLVTCKFDDKYDKRMREGKLLHSKHFLHNKSIVSSLENVSSLKGK